MTEEVKVEDLKSTIKETSEVKKVEEISPEKAALEATRGTLERSGGIKKWSRLEAISPMPIGLGLNPECYDILAYEAFGINYLRDRFVDYHERTWAETKKELKIKKVCKQLEITETDAKEIWNDEKRRYDEITESMKKEVRRRVLSRPEILLPGSDRLVSEFVNEISDIIKDKNKIFYRIDSQEVVQIDEICLGFKEVEPSSFVTLAEDYFTPGRDVFNEDIKETEFKKKSMSVDLAKNTLSSEILHKALKKINRIFTVPIPIVYQGQLTFPKRGYDERFCSWLPKESPDISNPNMPLEQAKQFLQDLFKEFCFKTEQDKVNAIAALLTPFLRGIFPSFNTRTPVIFYVANRERAGKDYLAGITGIVYEGFASEEPPINSSENVKTDNSEELRKKILSAFRGGKKRMHFSNNRGYISNAVFEGVITSERYTDRILGKSEELTFENEMDYSLSGNTGVGFTADLANRCRFVRMFLDIEDANSRTFSNPELHNWVRKNRGEVLSALYALVRNWIEDGQKEGSVSFTSFPQWARICGGIMETAGYLSPCTPDREILGVGGDIETQDMKNLFEKCYEHFGEEWVKKHAVKNLLISDEDGLFGYIDFNKREDQTKFSMRLTKFYGRILSNIKLVVKDLSVRASRQELKFTKETGQNLLNYKNICPEKVKNDEKIMIFDEKMPKNEQILGEKFVKENKDIVNKEIIRTIEVKNDDKSGNPGNLGSKNPLIEQISKNTFSIATLKSSPGYQGYQSTDILDVSKDSNSENFEIKDSNSQESQKDKKEDFSASEVGL